MSINKTIFNILIIGYFISKIFNNWPISLSEHIIEMFIIVASTIGFLLLNNIVKGKYIPFVYGGLYSVFINHVLLAYFDMEVSLTSIPYWIIFSIVSLISIGIDKYYDKKFFKGD